VAIVVLFESNLFVDSMFCIEFSLITRLIP